MLSKSVFTVLAFAVSTVSADYTFQTSPANDQILMANQGLNVQWDVQPGVSPDSNNAAPATLTVSLGYKDGNVPKLLFPSLGQTTLQARSFQWAAMDFTKFQTPAPPRVMQTEWFIQISDQSTAYKSNGQPFHIVEGDAGSGSGGSASGGSTSGSDASGGNGGSSGGSPATSGPAAPKPSGAANSTQTSKSAGSALAVSKVAGLVIPLVVSSFF